MFEITVYIQDIYQDNSKFDLITNLYNKLKNLTVFKQNITHSENKEEDDTSFWESKTEQKQKRKNISQENHAL